MPSGLVLGGLALLVRAHKAYPDLPEAAAACIKAGINHFLDRHKPAVTEALSRGLLKEADIDQGHPGQAGRNHQQARGNQLGRARTCGRRFGYVVVVTDGW